MVHGDVNLGVKGKDFRIIFSYTEHGIVSLVYGQTEWVYRPALPAFWRGTTENDKGNGFPKKSAVWLGADQFIQCTGWKTEEQENQVSITYEYQTCTNPAAKVEVAYTVYPTGAVRVHTHYFGRMAGSGSVYPVYRLENRRAGKSGFHYLRIRDLHQSSSQDRGFLYGISNRSSQGSYALLRTEGAAGTSVIWTAFQRSVPGRTRRVAGLKRRNVSGQKKRRRIWYLGKSVRKTGLLSAPGVWLPHGYGLDEIIGRRWQQCFADYHVRQTAVPL